MIKRFIESRRIERTKKLFTSVYNDCIETFGSSLPKWYEVKLNFINDEEIDGCPTAKMALDDSGYIAPAGTAIDLLVLTDESDNADAKVQRLRATIYVPMNTIKIITHNCRFKQKKEFASAIICRHEIGHIIDSYKQFFGLPLSSANEKIDENLKNHKSAVDKGKSMGKHGADFCTYVNSNSPREKAANKYGCITMSDLETLYKMINGYT